MNNILNLLGKPLLSLYECKIVGTISNFWLDKNCKKIKWLAIFNEDENEEVYQDISGVCSFSEDAVIIKNLNTLCLESEIDFSCNHKNPINNAVYNTLGKHLGTIKDIVFDDKNNITEYITTTSKFSIKDIAKCGESIIVLQDPKKLIKLPQPTKKIIVDKELLKNDQRVYTLPVISAPKEVSTPPKITTKNYDFLIGRKCNKNIYTNNNEIIIKKNTKITEKHLEIARINSKLRELAINSI